MAFNTTRNKTWLITGASSGLGLEMALSALRAGHRVIGTGRNTHKAALDNPEFEQLGGEWLQLDVSSPYAEGVVKQLVVREERLNQQELTHWVVVNNAGNTLLGTVEDMSDDQISQYLQTNLFGLIRIWRALIPAMRRHRTGTLISISSIWGFVSKPEHMMYSAAKATAESLTESYAQLLAPFGIRTMIIEPGGFRTKFPGNHLKPDGGITEDYRDKMEEWNGIIDAAAKDPTIVNGDPKLFGLRVVDAVERRGLFEGIWSENGTDKALRVQLGSDCYGLYGERLEQLQQGYARMARIASLTNVGS
ncbi:uncharacterized protein NECHADRAFT_41525 [Fusarium vanettenii 77-13-4]|uniref:Uncharacterized protein n=1 Tax=Fusarium vanettenii (strain ATCC MYA-4622 / CBS 123669 / FGSC 9596 / NRRL 45880 / 77-13-4) TaxID=660122 RepID=C7YS98_FUSV7|nr:uncharacterized protein NECHADRAFT_41525 [Fusarium vanettenii 77-13-4]EEU45597.1 hypothetical protein NECHADRAFT_41525 [Fusarium vanettenii 77-13-4]